MVHGRYLDLLFQRGSTMVGLHNSNLGFVELWSVPLHSLCAGCTVHAHDLYASRHTV